MGPTTLWPYDGEKATDDSPTTGILMGNSTLLLQAWLSNEDPLYTQLKLLWALPPLDPKNATIFNDASAPQAVFDPAPNSNLSENCNFDGSATNDAVTYASCFFSC